MKLLQVIGAVKDAVGSETRKRIYADAGDRLCIVVARGMISELLFPVGVRVRGVLRDQLWNGATTRGRA